MLWIRIRFNADPDLVIWWLKILQLKKNVHYVNISITVNQKFMDTLVKINATEEQVVTTVLLVSMTQAVGDSENGNLRYL